jgi:hypothetical protein
MVESAKKSVATKDKTESSARPAEATSKARKQEAAPRMAENVQQDAIKKDGQAKAMAEKATAPVQQPRVASKSKQPEVVQRLPKSAEPEAIIEENQANLTAFVEANEAIMAGMTALGAEVVGFGTKRLRDNIERTETLLACRDPEQAFRVQCEFFEQATQHYLEQANQVMTIMTAMTQNFWAPFEERTRETLRELNKEDD